jgi:hypothetical protein
LGFAVDQQSRNQPPQRQISPERKALYYFGSVLAVGGFLMFLSVFISGALHFGDFDDFHARTQSMGLRAVGGIMMIIIGMALASIGRAGLAGSGVKLDPQQARRDVEPWSRMSGGMLRDVLDEAGIDLGHRKAAQIRDGDLPFDEKLRRLHQLREDGILSEEEYSREKQELLDRN